MRVMRPLDKVFDCAGADGGAGDSFPLNEGDSISGKEVVL